MGVPIQVNNGIMGGLAAIASVHIWAKQEVKAWSVPINMCCDLLIQFNWHYQQYIPLQEPHQLTSFEWTFYITMEIIASQYQAAIASGPDRVKFSLLGSPLGIAQQKYYLHTIHI